MKPSWKRIRAGAVAMALVAAAACSSPQGTEQPENSLLGKGKGGKASNGRAGGGPGKGGGNGGKPGGTKNPGGAAAPSAPPGAAIPNPGTDGATGFNAASKTETEVASEGADPRTASVLVTEPDPDAEKSGIAPDFADILSTRVEGVGPNLRVTIIFRGTLPEKMPDGQTYMVAGFGMTPPKSKAQGYAFGASADTKGWTPYGAGNDGKDYPGQFSLSGDTIVFTIPWSAIDGPRSFEWYAQTSWFKSIAQTTHYSLDALPNGGPAKYPAG